MDNREINEAKKALLALQKEIFMTADRSGWHNTDRQLPESIALMHSELSEALEAYRDPNMDIHANYYRYKAAELYPNTAGAESKPDVLLEDENAIYLNDEPTQGNILGKPEGVASELADAIIRILDASEENNIPTVEAFFDKIRFNKTRPFRHGNKRA